MVSSRAIVSASTLKATRRILKAGSRNALVAATLLFTSFVAVQVQPSYGQANTAAGTIQGTISDVKGAVLPGATVTITAVATNVTKTIVTDSSGFYSAGALNPGEYEISVSVSGFNKTTEKLTVQIGNVANGNLKLTVGSSTTEVMVSADALQVNTTQSTVGGVLNAEQIDNLPISGRNFLDLAQLEPGVQLMDGQGFDPTKAGYSSVSVNGVNGRTARILLDGQDVSDETVGTTTFNVPLGSISEFEVARSSLDISNEITSSGSVTLSTRSGGNRIHGQAFGQFRDQRVAAANGPGGTDFPFQKDQFGGRVGGAFIKDKFFYFGSAERVKQDAFNSVQVSAPFDALSGGYTSPFRDNQYSGRVDYSAPKGIHLFFRGSYENNLDDATFGFGFSRYGNKDNTPAFAGGADFVTGRFTHEFRISYLKFHNLIADQTGSGIYNPVPGIFLQFATQGYDSGPNELAPQQTYQSDKQYKYDGGVTIRTHQIQYGMSLNRILGGGFASFFGLGPRVRGGITLSGLGNGGSGDPSDPTAYQTASITMGNGEGYFTETPQFGAPAGGQGDWRLGFYGGDTWKLTPKMTINYGMRWSRDTGRTDSDLAPIPCSDAVAAFGAADSPCTTGRLLDQVGTDLGAPVHQPNADFGPKAGFAYDPKGDGKMIIRGGMGLYYENSVFNNVLFDRPGKLKTGLFFGDIGKSNGTKSITLPDGSIVTSVNGVPLTTLWTDAISVSAPYWIALQQEYQAATAAAGPAANAEYVPNSLSSGPFGDSLYAPRFKVGRSVQMNIGVQRQVWKGAVFTADYIRNVGLHFQQAIDLNHVGDAKYLNTTAAQNAITATLDACGVATIDAALAACPGLHTDPTTLLVSGATISDFASNGMDSGVEMLGGTPAAYNGLDANHGAAFAGINPKFGQMKFNYGMGRSVYNALQTNLRQNGKIGVPGVRNSSVEISYTLSRFSSTGGADQNFTPNVVDNNNPLGFFGPAGLDRTHQLSYGGNLDWKYSIKTSIIGHWYSGLPTTLTLDDGGDGSGEIYHSDVTGDGTVADILPGYKAGAFGRSVKRSNLGQVIANYNATAANKLTPAGNAIVSAGLFTQAQMMAAGGLTRTIAAPPNSNAGNAPLKQLDFVLARPTKIKWLGDSGSIEPSIAAFNVFNFANFGVLAGNLADTQQSGTVNGTTTSVNDSAHGSLRAGNGSGVFSQGAARIMEFGLKINF